MADRTFTTRPVMSVTRLRLFADYLAGPGRFRNLNGWEKNR